MLDVVVDGDRLRFGERLAVSFHRTLRIPDDGRTYPLPPGFGLFPLVIARPEPGVATAPQLFVPLYQREALWLGFSAAPWKPNALKVIVGGINAVSGLPDDGSMLGEPQDYLVCPDQPWLDGFNAGGGVIRQFVAMPLGEGYGIEAGAGLAERGGIELVAFEPLLGRFPDTPPPGPMRLSRPAAATEEPREMALGAGGRMRQKIYPDRHGREVWDLANASRARVVILNSQRYQEVTGNAPPVTPIDAAAYTAAGLPWFDLYDEAEGTVAPDAGRQLKTIRERDRERKIAGPGDEPADVSVTQVTVIARDASPTSTDAHHSATHPSNAPGAARPKRKARRQTCRPQDKRRSLCRSGSCVPTTGGRNQWPGSPASSGGSPAATPYQPLH
jgi:hypothetical protein